MNFDNNIYIYVLEAVFILIIFLFFYKNKQKENIQLVEKLKEDINLLKNEQSDIKEVLEQKDTGYISSEIQKREFLEKEIQELHQVVQDTKNIAKNASMIKSEFLANVRHEVRTPMNFYLSFCRAFRKRLKR